MSYPSVSHPMRLRRVRRAHTMTTAAARLTLGILCILLVACDMPTPQLQDPTPTRPVLGTATPMPTRPVPSTATPTPDNARKDSGWQPLFAGAEVRRNLGNAARLALRLDPAAVTFAVAFNANPNQMQTVGAWLSAQAALAAVNCGFYLTTDQGENRHIGLLAGPDGALAPLRSGWGGVLLVRGSKASLAVAPASVSGDLHLGLQGWPMLVRSGKLAVGLDDSDAAARTAAAVDSQGRILFIADVTSTTLAEFARFLAASDLQIAQAVNLDGGSSTGLRYRATLNDPAAGYDSFFVPCAVIIK